VCFLGSRGPKRCSPIWTYFKVRITDGVVACVCSVNGCRYSNKGKNVTTLKNHLKTRHPTEFELCYKDKRAARPIPSGIAESLGNEASTNSSDKVEPYSRDSDEFKRLKLKVTIFAACTSFPLTLVNCPEFKGVTLYEKCRVFSRKLCWERGTTTKCWVCQEGQIFFLFAQKLRRPGIEPGTLTSSLDHAHSSALTASATSAG